MSIYQRVLPLWPREILISDGYAQNSKNKSTPDTIPYGGERFLFPSLSKAWANVEDSIDHKNDTWGSMLEWSMFQIFHKEAKRLILIGETHIKPAEIPLNLIEERFRENLNTEGWESERNAYEGL